MKLFLLLLMLVFFILIGVCVYKFYSVRHSLYADMVYICKSLKNNISFSKDNIKEILNSNIINLKFTTRKILNSLDSSNIFLKNDDREIIDKFFSSLGKGNVDYEINNITYHENNFENLKEQALFDLKNKGLLYMKLIIILGLVFFILLI
ncbi:MAG: hypothetical protein E7345_00415 [Clostridiales bacterium]|nr:hypothetical protein [Clostridiales bacterium]